MTVIVVAANTTLFLNLASATFFAAGGVYCLWYALSARGSVRGSFSKLVFILL